MSNEKLRDVAKLVGDNQFGDVVYSVRLPLHEYYDGDHPSDTSDGVKQLKIVKMIGTQHDSHGNNTQECESAFSPETGLFIGGRAQHDDGKTRRDGIFADT